MSGSDTHANHVPLLFMFVALVLGIALQHFIQGAIGREWHGDVQVLFVFKLFIGWGWGGHGVGEEAMGLQAHLGKVRKRLQTLTAQNVCGTRRP